MATTTTTTTTTARKSASAATIARVARLIARRDAARANVADARKRVASAGPWVARARSVANRAAHAARPAVIGTAALSAAATIVGHAPLPGVTFKLSASETVALADRYESFKRVAGERVTVTVAESPRGLRGLIATGSPALADAERDAADAAREVARADAALASLITKRDAATQAARDALASLSTADRKRVADAADTGV